MLCALALAATAAAQVPDGYAIFGCFGSGPGGQGIYFAHPRDPNAPIIPVTNLPQNLSSAGSSTRGVAALMYRRSDGALLVGERAPGNSSVDLHVLRLSGNDVVFAQLYSCGTSAGVGEIPQFAMLPDGRLVIAATDLMPGSNMAHFTNGQYNWQGLSILDLQSGAFTAIQVSNWAAFTGVMNGLAVSRDGSTIYLGAWISPSAGALWEIPVAGGQATLIASLPFGNSNIAIDHDDTVLLTTLNGPPNLFRYDPATQILHTLPSSVGPLNAISVEAATGNCFYATANAGTPPRSLLWREPNGPDRVLQATPTAATISAVDSNPNPENFGAGTPGVASYRFQAEPNPGGLPLAGNAAFSLTVRSNQQIVVPGVIALGLQRIAPTLVFGIELLIDPNSAVAVFTVLAQTATVPLGLPANTNLVGLELFGQSIWIEPSGALASSDGVMLTVL